MCCVLEIVLKYLLCYNSFLIGPLHAGYVLRMDRKRKIVGTVSQTVRTGNRPDENGYRHLIPHRNIGASPHFRSVCLGSGSS